MHGKESLLILALLSRHYTIMKEVVFNFKYLYDMLEIPTNRKKRKQTIIECVNSMFGVGIELGANANELRTLPYITNKNQYVAFTNTEVDTILSYKDEVGNINRIDKFNLFNTYVVIKRYVNFQTKKAYPPIILIMDTINVASNSSVIKYINILEELDMIECIRSDGYIVNGNEIKRPNNEYIVKTIL